jgi:hypothetical protein
MAYGRREDRSAYLLVLLVNGNLEEKELIDNSRIKEMDISISRPGI